MDQVTKNKMLKETQSRHLQCLEEVLTMRIQELHIKANAKNGGREVLVEEILCFGLLSITDDQIYGLQAMSFVDAVEFNKMH